MSDPRLLATQRVWAAVGELERRLEGLEGALTALCARLGGDMAVDAVAVPPVAGEASSEPHEAHHA